jgi:nucleoid DNA-binding protein
MNKRDLAAQLSDRSGLSLQKAQTMVGCFADVLHTALVEGEPVLISGFGTLRTHTRQAHTGVDPNSGQPIDVPVRKRVIFKASEKFKDRLNPS